MGKLHKGKLSGKVLLELIVKGLMHGANVQKGYAWGNCQEGYVRSNCLGVLHKGYLAGGSLLRIIVFFFAKDT